MTIHVDTLPSKEMRRVALESRYPVWPRNTLATHFSNASITYGDRDFIYMADGRKATYAEIWEKAEDYAKALINLGVKRRDHVAILMENDLSYPSLIIATSMIGAVCIPLNTMLNKEDLSYILTQSDSRFLIFHDKVKDKNHAKTIVELLDETDFQKHSQLAKAICVTSSKEHTSTNFLSWDAFCKGAQAVSNETLTARKEASLYPDEVAIILYTSGSTGKSKGVMLTHDMMLRCAYSTCLSRAIEDGRITFAPLPFYHCFAIIEALFAMSFVGGAVISSPSFSPLTALQLMEKYKANDFLCVPSMLVPLLNHPRVHEFDLSHLFAIWCGAAPAPVPVWKKAMDVLGLTEVLTGYGQTEVSSSGVTTEVGDPIERISSRVGRPKLGGVCGLPEFNGSTVQYKTVNQDTGQDLPAGSVGELVVRGNTVTHGYYNNPEETAATIDKDGWLRTGDIGRIDALGYIEVLGRRKDIYKVSGEIVAPREVEEVISKHPAVNNVYIVGVPDKMTTETGAAFIELKAGENCTRREIVEWCAARIARFKIPRYVWFIEASDWPMTSTGKVQKFRLQEIAIEKLEKK
ncbi:class I adenylate-forming enzyme family protein [Virgibacillus soli]|uniref:Class I adenylate-forming enzyme family protein n=1 Tax=Paracerasibacillus soli TaxID=480284 RepID=A0ABU5CU06_9BACI|nr:class I adenylate-forming enzyme family protein [Virgibacillus soli]MDY0409700.1 class I adenylate-forming enzyme family protein [Virgibacillus soli]